MSATKLPTRTDGASFYSFEIELEGRTYNLSFSWNERDGAWFLDVADDEGAVLLAGLKVVLETPLLARFRSRASLPPGDFFAWDTSDDGVDAGLLELGNRVQLLYLTADEFA